MSRVSGKLSVKRMLQFIKDSEVYDMKQECYIEVFRESVNFVVGKPNSCTSMSFGKLTDNFDSENKENKE